LQRYTRGNPRRGISRRWRSANTGWRRISACRPRRINEIVHGKRGITADTALRLGHYFGMTPQFWMNLQARYDLETEADRLGKAIGRCRC